MKINIFGVGTSGTKAIQLYLTYLLIEKEGMVKVNYEPYYWLNRKTNELNYEGIFHHITSNLILKEGQLTKLHADYLLSLYENDTKKDISIVTKFIRANGRIEEINKVMKPDLTIVVIRDVYSVLASLSSKPWDLLGEYLVYPNDWERLLDEIKTTEILPEKDLSNILKAISSKQDRNAFYWYIMNMLAIQSNKYVDLYVPYSKLEMMENLPDKFGLHSHHSIYNERFKGSNIYNDSVIIDHPGITPPKIGSINIINSEEKSSFKSELKKKTFANPYKNKLYDFFNGTIERKLLKLNMSK